MMIKQRTIWAAVIGIFMSIAVRLVAGEMSVEAVVAVDKDTKPTTSFSSDVPKIYCFFRTKGSEKGDKLRAVWIADDVGDAAPADTKIDEASLTADQDNFFGAFSLSKPTKGWPVGKYHVDIYNGDDVGTTVKFTIKGGKAPAKSDEDESSEEE